MFISYHNRYILLIARISQQLKSKIVFARSHNYYYLDDSRSWKWSDAYGDNNACQDFSSVVRCELNCCYWKVQHVCQVESVSCTLRRGPFTIRKSYKFEAPAGWTSWMILTRCKLAALVKPGFSFVPVRQHISVNKWLTWPTAVPRARDQTEGNTRHVCLGDVAKVYGGVTSFHQEAETLPTDLVFVAAFMNLWYIFGMPINDTLQCTVIGKDGPDERCLHCTKQKINACHAPLVSNLIHQFSAEIHLFSRNSLIFLSSSSLFIQLYIRLLF